MTCCVFPVISTCLAFVVAKKKTINCDEHCMTMFGAHFLTNSVFQLRLDPHKLNLIRAVYLA